MQSDADTDLHEIITWVCDLMDEADGALDRDTHDEMSRLRDPADDAEICIRVATRGKLNQLFVAIAELRRRGARPQPGSPFGARQKVWEDEENNPHGLPWRVAPWGDGSSPTGHSNIFSDAWQVTVASELLTETAEFIVEKANGWSPGVAKAMHRFNRSLADRLKAEGR